MKKIDNHCHTTNRILKEVANPDASLAAIAGYREQYEIVQTVLLATYFPRRGTGISNYRLRHWIQGKPESVMFGSLDFETFFYQGFNELEELAEEGVIKGIKLYPAYQRIDRDSNPLALQAKQRYNGTISASSWSYAIDFFLSRDLPLPALRL